MSWEDSYLGQLRKIIGHKKIIHPSVRAIINDKNGKILFIERRGENKWGLPSGSMELGESILETLKREVKEETGIEIKHPILIAIYTGPNKSIKNEFGDEYQLFEFLFLVDEWSGDILERTEETVNAHFYPLESIPLGTSDFWDIHQREVIEDFKTYKGQLILK